MEMALQEGKRHGQLQATRAANSERIPTITEAVKGTHIPGHGYMWTAQLSGTEYPSLSSTSLLTNVSP